MWSERDVFFTFCLRNVLRARTACTVWTSQLPKAVRTWCVFAFWFLHVLRITTVCTFSTSQLPTVVRTWCVFAFWLRRVLRTTACTFSTSQLTSKSGPVFHILTSKCAGRRSLFQRLNSQKWSGTEVFLPFWLRNALRATTACIFWSLISRHGSAPATLANLLFNPPSHKTLEQHSVSRFFMIFLRFRPP